MNRMSTSPQNSQNTRSYKQIKGEWEKASRQIKEVNGVQTTNLLWTRSWQMRCRHQIRRGDHWIELHPPFYKNTRSYEQRKVEWEKTSRKIKEVKGVWTAYLPWPRSWRIRCRHQIKRSATASNIDPPFYENKQSTDRKKLSERRQAGYLKKWKGCELLTYCDLDLGGYVVAIKSNARPLHQVSLPPSIKIRGREDRENVSERRQGRKLTK